VFNRLGIVFIVNFAGSSPRRTSLRGRTPSQPESVEQLTGSAKAKDRVRVILQTMAGDFVADTPAPG
jgi:hypothetical protein